jgi:hypothetical protein
VFLLPGQDTVVGHSGVAAGHRVFSWENYIAVAEYFSLVSRGTAHSTFVHGLKSRVLKSRM